MKFVSDMPTATYLSNYSNETESFLRCSTVTTMHVRRFKDYTDRMKYFFDAPSVRRISFKNRRLSIGRMFLVSVRNWCTVPGTPMFASAILIRQTPSETRLNAKRFPIRGILLYYYTRNLATLFIGAIVQIDQDLILIYWAPSASTFCPFPLISIH